jgi:hypothetical protein
MPNTPTYILYHGRNTGKDKDSKKIWTRFFHGDQKRGCRTRVRICAETYDFARQKIRGGSMNLILISWMSFLVDF